MYLQLIEGQSAYYYMRFSRTKLCVHCTFPYRDNRIAFAAGTPMRSVNESVYLGIQIAKQVDPRDQPKNLNDHSETGAFLEASSCAEKDNHIGISYRCTTHPTA